MNEEEYWTFLYAKCPYCDAEFLVERGLFYEPTGTLKKAKAHTYCVNCGKQFPFFPEAAPKGIVELTEESMRMLDMKFKSKKE